MGPISSPHGGLLRTQEIYIVSKQARAPLVLIMHADAILYPSTYILHSIPIRPRTVPTGPHLSARRASQYRRGSFTPSSPPHHRQRLRPQVRDGRSECLHPDHFRIHTSSVDLPLFPLAQVTLDSAVHTFGVINTCCSDQSVVSSLYCCSTRRED